MSIADIRKEYTRGGLTEAEADLNPFVQFHHWLEQAISGQLPEPNSMTLATVSSDGKPSARIVLLKAFDERGVVFFTNYLSRKGLELAVNPHAALVFHWIELERQVRIEGKVEKTSESESEGYFQTRPEGSKFGAWISEQSTVISGREILEAREKELRAQFGQNVPKPPNWGGYRLVPEMFEFWQGRRSRLHDRLRYRLEKGVWIRERLSP
jgi:pyridoxamine 5'-phosphate oxidase